MSRVGIKQIDIPSGVKVVREKESVINITGPKGTLTFNVFSGIDWELKDNKLTFKRANDERELKSKHGLMRNLAVNMVKGVTLGYEKKLEIVGVGYKAKADGKSLDLSVGYSHPVIYPIPQGIAIKVDQNTQLTITGIDKQLVGQVAADIRAYYPPEPYKGKGIKYAGEHIKRKAGKTIA